jgi:hypothetical protein
MAELKKGTGKGIYEAQTLTGKHAITNNTVCPVLGVLYKPDTKAQQALLPKKPMPRRRAELLIHLLTNNYSVAGFSIAEVEQAREEIEKGK